MSQFRLLIPKLFIRETGGLFLGHRSAFICGSNKSDVVRSVCSFAINFAVKGRIPMTQYDANNTPYRRIATCFHVFLTYCHFECFLSTMTDLRAIIVRYKIVLLVIYNQQRNVILFWLRSDEWP